MSHASRRSCDYKDSEYDEQRPIRTVDVFTLLLGDVCNAPRHDFESPGALYVMFA